MLGAIISCDFGNDGSGDGSGDEDDGDGGSCTR